MKAQHLARRRIKLADLPAAGFNALQPAHALKKLELPRGLPDVARENRLSYIRIRWPARGSHSRNASFLWRVWTTNWLKLLSVA